MLAAAIVLFCVAAQNEPGESKVYFTEDISSDGVMKLIEKVRGNISGKVGVKVHFGEEGNEWYLSPELSSKLIETFDGTYVETNILYVSTRRYTDSHLALAKRHGFDPVRILESNRYKEIPVNLKHYKSVRAAEDIDDFDTYIVFSHFKGHAMAGFGGAIKNVSMGLSAIAGKMAMHASSIPIYHPEKCIQCGECVKNCPGNAISLNPLTIDQEKCIGCGACIGICPVRAFSIPWGSTDNEPFMERLVEYAYGITKGRNMIYVNVLKNISPDCDCMAHARDPFVHDIGILVSTDIVAIEQASLDLVNRHFRDGKHDAFVENVGHSGERQIDYAEELGLGKREYRLIEVE